MYNPSRLFFSDIVHSFSAPGKGMRRQKTAAGWRGGRIGRAGRLLLQLFLSISPLVQLMMK